MDKRTCSVTDCDRVAQSRGWCRSHYMRWYCHGSVDDSPLARRDPGRGCGVEGCERPHATGGWCAPHYKRVLTYGHPGSAEIRPRSVGDAASYHLVHSRLRNTRGRARNEVCVECSQPAAHWAYDHSDPNEKTCRNTGAPYSVDINHYDPMCARCHKRADMQRLRDERPYMTVGIDSRPAILGSE